jgi:hypothetical protein
MVALSRVIVAALAVAVPSVCEAGDLAQAGAPNDPSFLFFTGTDLWRYGDFFYGGLLWSPAGLDADGFTLKILLNGGAYTYTSGALDANVNGTMLSGATLPGWRFTRDNLTVSVFAGPAVGDYRLTPNDPTSHLHGFYFGAQFAGEVWYQPSPHTMAAVNGTISSIGPTGSLRVAYGFKIFEPMFIGPETQEIWCGDFQEVQFGGHITGLHINAFEWSAGSGWSITSDHRRGPYLRVGVNMRY